MVAIMVAYRHLSCSILIGKLNADFCLNQEKKGFFDYQI